MSDDMSMSDDKETNYDPRVIRRIARFFKQKLRRLDDEEIEDLQDMVLNPETENLAEMFLREDISDRMKSFKEKAMMRGGVGMMGAGMLGMISQAMGYTDAGELMTQVHDYVDMMGGGPVSTAVLIAGLVMALKGTADRSERLGK
jgi:Na+/H+ antiporter NhaB